GARLEQHWITDALGGNAETLRALVCAMVTGDQRHTGLLHQCLGSGLAAHRLNGGGGWADEDQSGGLDGAGEVGILGKKAIAWMDRLGAAGQGGVDQLVDRQVAVGRLGASQVDAPVRRVNMAGVVIDGAVYGYGGQAHGLGRAHDPAGDLAAIGNQQGGDHDLGSGNQLGRRLSRKARSPSWPSALTRIWAMTCSVCWRRAGLRVW